MEGQIKMMALIILGIYVVLGIVSAILTTRYSTYYNADDGEIFIVAIMLWPLMIVDYIFRNGFKTLDGFVDYLNSKKENR